MVRLTIVSVTISALLGTGAFAQTEPPSGRLCLTEREAAAAMLQHLRARNGVMEGFTMPVICRLPITNRLINQRANSSPALAPASPSQGALTSGIAIPRLDL